ncbi:MAG TPA: right-handed parallel beta-helix repeat-containing protein [Planctomycetota bacterium]|nr:right-handed parallel beta-helix repeat-containing protein [Planctomycetota bacterium]
MAAEKPAAATPPVPQLSWYTKVAPKLPWPTGGVVKEVRTPAELLAAVNDNPASGSTILVHDGFYAMPDLLWLRSAKNVTIRGYSGDRSKVILDAAKSKHEDMLWIWHCDGVLVADLTFQNSRVHGITVKGESDTQNTRIYNCVFHNIWERKIKGTAAATAGGQPAKGGDPHALQTRPANGRIEYCLFYDDHKKDVDDFANGDYIAGIDLMWLKNWVISDNVFMNIQGRHGVARGAIFLWNNGEDVIVERNLIVNCDRGICIGNPSGDTTHMTRGIVRDNMVVRGHDAGMEICRTVDCQVYNNTIWGEDAGFRQALQVKEGKGSAQVFNNLVRGQIDIQENGSKDENNMTGPLDGFFVNPAQGDLHLAPAGLTAVHQRSVRTPKDFLDWDGGLRPAQCDLGADETYTTAAPASKTATFVPPVNASAPAGNGTVSGTGAALAVSADAGGGEPVAGGGAGAGAAVVAPAGAGSSPERLKVIKDTRAMAIALLIKLIPKTKGLRTTLVYQGSAREMDLLSADEKDGVKVKVFGALRSIPWTEFSGAALAGLVELCTPGSDAAIEAGIKPPAIPGIPGETPAASTAENFAAIALLYAIESQPVPCASAMQKAIDQDPELKDTLKTALALLH